MKRKASRKAKPARAPKRRQSVQSRKPPKTKREDCPSTQFVTANAKALGLTLDPAWHASIAFNLRLILRHAAQVDEFALPDDAEPTPVFHA